MMAQLRSQRPIVNKETRRTILRNASFYDVGSYIFLREVRNIQKEIHLAKGREGQNKIHGKTKVYPAR